MGTTVSVVDEDAEALQRLPDDWPGQFVQGHGLDLDVLIDAGIENADAVVVCTDGDNTNIVIAQVGAEAIRGAHASSRGSSTRLGPRSTRARAADGVRDLGGHRIHDPGRSALLRAGPRRTGPVYILIAGGGKVGANLASTLHQDGPRGVAAR